MTVENISSADMRYRSNVTSGRKVAHHLLHNADNKCARLYAGHIPN